LLLALLGAGCVLSTSTIAQSVARPARLGFLCNQRCDTAAVIAFRDELRRLGWVEGANLAIDFRAAEGRAEQFPVLAQELVDQKPDVVVVSSPQPSAAMKRATSTIPIVFAAVADPVSSGLVASLARPGGNVTGIATASISEGIIGKQLEQLKQAVPGVRRIAVLLNPDNAVTSKHFPMQAPPAAEKLGVALLVYEIRSTPEIEPAIQRAVKDRADALWVVGDPLLNSPPERVPALAARARLPAVYLDSLQVTAGGGLMSYGPDFPEIFRLAARHADRILKGAKPADLPVVQNAKFSLVLNLKTASALGITIPAAVQQHADEIVR